MSTTRPHTSATEATPVFPTVLCGVGRTRADADAARQAAPLAGSGTLDLLCAWYAVGKGLSAQATITQEAAERALEKARVIAREACDDVHVRTVLAEHPVDVLLEEGAGHDLVVVGSHEHHRGGGIMTGSVATNLAHRLTVPLLVARPADAGFPGTIVVASDGSGSAHTAVRMAARVASAHGCPLRLVHVDVHDDAHLRRGLAFDSAELFEQFGFEPVVINERGDPAEAIARAAADADASLVVVGSRGLTGVRALGSVSERVVHSAPCSVLVTRHP